MGETDARACDYHLGTYQQRTAQVTDATRSANAELSQSLNWADAEDEDFAQRGFIAAWDQPQIRTADGRVAWDFTAYNFLTPQVPETVNPSLWRQARLLARAGLFRVSDRVYQVRGFDISNMTIVVGDTGLIIIDPLTTREPAAAALALARRTHRRSPRASPSSTRTPTPITSAASRALWTQRMSRPAGLRSSRPKASWSTPSPRTSSPATP